MKTYKVEYHTYETKEEAEAAGYYWDDDWITVLKIINDGLVSSYNEHMEPEDVRW